MRIALGIEYDGAGFNGWQTQADGRIGAGRGRTRAGRHRRQRRFATICAGRTDAGVHALDQVVHFDTAVERPLTAWVRGVNRFLPPTSGSALGAPGAGETFTRVMRRCVDGTTTGS